MRWPIVFAGIAGAAMVAIGAAASHGLAGGDALAENWLRTAAQYGLWHCLALLGVAGLAGKPGSSRLLNAAALCFAAGIVLFSGSLILRALTDIYWISRPAPLGGLAFIAGWLLLAAFGATRGRPGR